MTTVNDYRLKTACSRNYDNHVRPRRNAGSVKTERLFIDVKQDVKKGTDAAAFGAHLH